MFEMVNSSSQIDLYRDSSPKLKSVKFVTFQIFRFVNSEVLGVLFSLFLYFSPDGERIILNLRGGEALISTPGFEAIEARLGPKRQKEGECLRNWMYLLSSHQRNLLQLCGGAVHSYPS